MVLRVLPAAGHLGASGAVQHGAAHARKLALLDVDEPRRESLVPIPSFLPSLLLRLRVLRRREDVHLAAALVQAAAWICFSAWVQLYLLPNARWACAWAVVHAVVTFLVFGGRFILAMHYAAHVRLTPWAEVNAIPTAVMSIFWGLPVGMYHMHHTCMHHLEENVYPYDLSSTMPYQRDSILDFIIYVHRFLCHSYFHLIYYAFRKRGVPAAAQLVTFLVGGIWLQMLAYTWHPPFFFTFVLVPTVLGSFGMMLGNFSQHIFVDAERYASAYGMTVTMLRAPANPIVFNDGYHANHHVNSMVHWSELPSRFADAVQTFADEDALVFDGLNFDDLGVAAMTGDLRRLASRCVQLREPFVPEEQVVEKLRRLLRPVAVPPTEEDRAFTAVHVANELFYLVSAACGYPVGYVALILTLIARGIDVVRLACPALRRPPAQKSKAN